MIISNFQPRAKRGCVKTKLSFAPAIAGQAVGFIQRIINWMRTLDFSPEYE